MSDSPLEQFYYVRYVRTLPCAPIPWAAFVRRIPAHLAVVAGSLPAGMAGYVPLEGHNWGTAFLHRG